MEYEGQKKQTTRAEYGENFSDHLMEQYKMYVATTENVSERRFKTNQFYVSLLSGLLAVLSFITSQPVFSNVVYIVFVSISLLGGVLCAIWWSNINSYKQLNMLKFIVIHEMETLLPFACYQREWQTEKETEHKYIRLTMLEKYIPLIMAIPYLLLAGYSVYMIFQSK